MTPERILFIMAIGILVIAAFVIADTLIQNRSQSAAPLPVGKEGASRGGSVREGIGFTGSYLSAVPIEEVPEMGGLPPADPPRAVLEIVREPGARQREPEDWSSVHSRMRSMLNGGHVYAVHLEDQVDMVTLTISGDFSPTQVEMILERAACL